MIMQYDVVLACSANQQSWSKTTYNDCSVYTALSLKDNLIQCRLESGEPSLFDPTQRFPILICTCFMSKP